MCLSSNCRSNQRLIRPPQPSTNRLNERSVSLKSKLTSFRLERRMVRDQRELMLDESAERFGNEIELHAKLLVGPAQSIKSDTEPIVKFGGTAPLQPSTESVGENRSLRRAGLGCERFELLREVAGQIELVPRLEGLHAANSGVHARLKADGGGRTSLLFDESRSDLRSGTLPAEGPRDVPSAHDPGHLFADLTFEHRPPRHKREVAGVLDDRHAHHPNLD